MIEKPGIGQEERANTGCRDLVNLELLPVVPLLPLGMLIQGK